MQNRPRPAPWSRRRVRASISVGLISSGLATTACSSNVNNSPKAFSGSNSNPALGDTGSGTNGTARSGNPGNGAGSGSASGLIDIGGGTSAGTNADDAATCASQSLKGQIVPVDIFIMMDQSGSMLDKVTGPNGTSGVKWDFLKQAFTTFVQDPNSAGIGVGIQYFPIPNVDDSSCDAGTYAVTNDPTAPASGQGVGIAPLPGNAAAIVTSLGMHTPGGQTPTVPALAGALMYAKNWEIANPTHKVVVVFATDGTPNGCSNNTIPAAAAVAQAAAAGTPPIATYVIGIGNKLTALDQIAQGGGTAPALVVNTTQDTAAQFLAAMNQIRSSTSIPCVLTIPSGDGGAVDYDKVNVVKTPPDGGAAANILQVPDTTQCDANVGGWFYDNPAAPKTINLCPTTCTQITQEVTDQVDILLGCKTLTYSPR